MRANEKHKNQSFANYKDLPFCIQWAHHLQANTGFIIQGTRTGVPLTVYPWYLLCSTLGFLGIITHKYPLYRAYIGISHRDTLVGVHPCLSPDVFFVPARLQNHQESERFAKRVGGTWGKSQVKTCGFLWFCVLSRDEYH